MKVPLIPFNRPVPQIFLKKEPVGTKPSTKRKDSMVATKKPKFIAQNIEDVTQKPQAVERIWKILAQMDPTAALWANDTGIVLFEGAGPQDRTPKALKLKSEDIALLRPYAVYDGPEPDDQEKATGVFLTVFQIVELAYALGAQDEAAKVTKALASAADEEDPDLIEEPGVEGDTESFDDEMDEIADDAPPGEDDDDDDVTDDQDDDSDDDDDDDDDE